MLASSVSVRPPSQQQRVLVCLLRSVAPTGALLSRREVLSECVDDGATLLLVAVKTTRRTVSTRPAASMVRRARRAAGAKEAAPGG
eukprot:gene20307-6764_t